MYYPGLVHETNTIKNTGVAPTGRHTNTLAGRPLSTRPPPLTLFHTAFTGLHSLSLSLSLPPPPPLGHPGLCATDPAHTGRAGGEGASHTLTRGRLTAHGH